MRRTLPILTAVLFACASPRAQSGNQTAPTSTANTPPAHAASLIGIPGEDETPESVGLVATTIVHARYPLAVPDPNLGGTILVEVAISQAGDVERAKAIKGEKELYGCAVDAIKQWKFEPYKKKGNPRKVSTVVAMGFFPAEKLSADLGVVQPTSDRGDNRIVQLSEPAAESLLVLRVQATYPPQAIQMRLQGQARLRVIIGKDGTVRDLKLVSAHPVLAGAAMDAVRQWRYEPYKISGEPAEVQTSVNLNFILPEE